MELIIVFGWLLSTCKCSRDIVNHLTVDCYKMNLTDIPRIPDDTVFLHLNDNEIEGIDIKEHFQIFQIFYRWICQTTIPKGLTDASSYADESFADMLALTTLKIDGKPNAIFGAGFAKLQRLHMLKL
ncbi:hypothetical protein ACJMK2_018988 [Sinanodonta woodiana]|uniref:Uncharacterized protein n=1 Tax=Sinanodonta woodiana TaxID=1069815 RepID=A0ABD3UF16_SINWO